MTEIRPASESEIPAAARVAAAALWNHPDVARWYTKR